jgi:TRAP-type uncharacterized transport system substrate-binding protein
MRRWLASTFVALRAWVLAFAPFLLVGVGLVALAFHVLQPNPPRYAVMVTGPERSAFEAFGERYRHALARHGITLELRSSGGAVANLQALVDPDGGVDFGFVQGGTLTDDLRVEPPLRSLGVLFNEAVWVFHRRAAARGRAVRLADVASWRIAAGSEASGAPQLFRRLLTANGIDPASVPLQPLGETEAVMALFDGRLDAVVFVSAPESSLVQMLLRTPGVSLLEVPQAEAYARRYAFLTAVSLPRGIVSIERDLPPRPHPLVATTASLVVREGTHPALIQLMVQAAAEIHGGPGWFARAGDYPTARGAELPMADEALRYLRNGPPWLQRYLPWWLANLLDRMWIALAAIVAVLLPLSRVIPPLYEWRVRSRVFRWYAELRRIEDELIGGVDAGQRDELRARLDALDARVEGIDIPLSYADELYFLRSHIALVRARIDGAGPWAAGAPAGSA